MKKIGVLSLVLAVFVSGCHDTSMKMNDPHNVRGVISYQRAFPDLNEAHLEAAKAIGIAPIATHEDAARLKKKLKKIGDSEWYDVDQLTHSVPYLVPKAAKLLDVIGKNFQDSLTSKGLNPYKIIVTSALRTEADVEKLTKRNRNAIKDSPHSFGTTVDISWKRFNQIPGKHGRPMQEVNADTLKMVLSEVLRDLREGEQCYVKYERKQACFHLTAR